MINSAQNYNVSDLLKYEQDIRYVIPRYQREYSWGKREWEALFDDIWDNNPGHFLGTIICINQSKDALEVLELELVDGQQRLTTISILYAVIYAALNRPERELDDEQMADKLNLRRRLVFRKDEKNYLRLQLSYQNSNHDDYHAVVARAGILSPVQTPSYAGNRKIFRAYRYFESRLAQKDTDGNPLFGSRELFLLLSKINGAFLVKIEVADHADAYTLFESLNNRGMPLSAIDLIKNKLLATVEKQGVGDMDTCFDRWSDLLGQLVNDYTVQERFLRQFYNAFRFDKKVAVERINIATRSNIIHIYQELINRSAGWTLDRLHECSRLYNRLVNPDNEANPDLLASQLRRLERIGGAPSYLLLLYLLDQKNLADNKMASLVEFLVRFFVRRNLTDYPPTRDLTRMFVDIIDIIRSNDGDIDLDIRRFLTNESANEEQFRANLSGDIYAENAWVTRFVLCSIEELNQTKEILTDLWKRNGSQYVWTIEHIFPQGKNIPSKWVQIIAGGDDAKAVELQDKYVHKIGNLTISGYNSMLGNLSFAEKRDRVNKQGMSVGYKNGLYLNRELKHLDSWSVVQIEKRTEELVDIALDIFRLDS